MNAFARAARAAHRRLLPAKSEIGWTPYLWLFYLSLFVWRWVQEPPSSEILALGGVCLLAFFGLYFNGYWQRGWRLTWNIVGILAIAIVLTPFNQGALTFFVYAAAFCGALGPPRRGWLALSGILVVVSATGWVLGMSWVWWVITLCLSAMIGATNIYFVEVSRKNADLRRSQDEVEQLAAVAERERIARDLHDLLGHTLTVITVKAELARRFAERGDPRAVTEIADVERISREASRQVREAVAGFHEMGLVGELRRARVACAARGIALESALSGELAADVLSQLGARGETALAMVLREAVTNVVRHSRASRCTVALERLPSEVVLTVEDDGRGSVDLGALSSDSGSTSAPAHDRSLGRSLGHGLASMRQRLELLGGHLEVAPGTESRGVRLSAHLPIEAPVAAPETSEAAAPRARTVALPAAGAAWVEGIGVDPV